MMRPSVWYVWRMVGILGAILLVTGVHLIPLARAAESRASLLKLDGVAGFVEGRVRQGLARALSEQGTDWLCDAVAQVVTSVRDGTAKDDLKRLLYQDAATRERVRAEFVQRLKPWLTEQVRDVIARDLLGAVVGKEQAAEVQAIVDRVTQELSTSFNDRIDAVASQYYDGAIAELRDTIRAAGAPAWVDVTDLRATLKQGLDLTTLSTIAANEFARLVGEGVVQGIRGRVQDALSGNLPPEAVAALDAGPEAFDRYREKIGEYLPGEQLQSFTSSVLHRPIVRLPNEVYAGVLAGTAAGHYARAFSGITVDTWELKRAAEVTRVMVWQLEHKQAVNVSVLQLGALARDVAAAAGLGNTFEGLLAKLKGPLDRIQAEADRIDQLLKQPLARVHGELRDAASRMQRYLQEMQAQLVAPVQEVIESADTQLAALARKASDAIPDIANGIPADWDALKERAGLDEGLLGEAGEQSPEDLLRKASDTLGVDDAIERVRDTAIAVRDQVVDGLANSATRLLESAHLLGPTAAILKVDRMPTQHPSLKSALDPVILSSGEYIVSHVDLRLPGHGLDLIFERTYLGRADFKGEFGWRWTHSYAQRLLPAMDHGTPGLTHVGPDGRKRFYREEQGALIAPAGVGARLERTPDGYRLTERNGTHLAFDALGRMTSRTDRAGNTIRCEYGEDGLLARLIDTLGRNLIFHRNTHGLITALEDASKRRIEYQYDERDDLVAAIAPEPSPGVKPSVTAYRYGDGVHDPLHAITMIVDPNGRVWLRNRYDAEGRVVAQRLGKDAWMTVAYGPGDGQGIAARTWVTDARGLTRLYEHDAEGQLVRQWHYRGEEALLELQQRFDATGRMTWSCDITRQCWHAAFLEDPQRIVPSAIEWYPADNAPPRITTIDVEPRFQRVAFIEHPNGEALRMTYADTTSADLIHVEQRLTPTSPWVTIERLEYGAPGELARRIDSRGVVTRYTYEQGALVRAVVDAETSADRTLSAPLLRATTRIAYDPLGQVAMVTRPDGSRERFVHDAVGRLLREERPGLAPIRYQYDANDNVVEVVIERGNAWIHHRFTYGDLDQLEERDLELDATTRAIRRWAYDASGELRWERSEEGALTGFEDDVQGDLLCVTRAEGTLERARSCVERDMAGRVIAMRDATGAVTRVQYNGFGEVVAQIDPLGTQTEMARDHAGRVVGVRVRSQSGVLLREERYAWEGDRVVEQHERLWLEKVEQARWLTTHFTFDAAGLLVAMTAPDGTVTRSEYDALGNRIATQDPDGVRHVEERDVMGRVCEEAIESQGRRWHRVQFTHDEAGRITARTDPLGMVTTFAYDAQGWLARIVPPAGPERQIERDAVGRVIRLTTRGGGEVQTQTLRWDREGRLLVVRDAAGQFAQYDWDALDRVIAERSADNLQQVTTYDAAGRIAAVMGSDKTIARYERDALGRVLSRVVERNEQQTRQQYRYDALGRLVFALDEGVLANRFDDQSTHVVYDSRSRPVAEASSNRWLMRTYNDRDAVIARSVDGSPPFMFERDAMDRMIGVLQSGRRLATIERDPTGLLVRAQLFDGIHLAVTRDVAGQTLTRSYRHAEGLLAAWRYEYDPAGRVTQTADLVSGVTSLFTRDGLGRLVSAVSSDGEAWRYAYDAADRMHATQYTKPDGTVSLENAALENDAAGRLVTDGTWRYEYDLVGRLASVHRGQELLARYRYDALDRRVLEEYGDIGQSLTWDRDRVVAMARSDAAAVAMAFEGDDALAAPILYQRGGELRALLTDRMGATQAEVDDVGQEVARTRFGPYGELVARDTKARVFTFAGMRLGADKHILNARYRDYDASHGRFLVPDPLGIAMPLVARASVEVTQGLSYHRGQGQSSRLSIPFRMPSTASVQGAPPFARLLERAAPFAPPQLNRTRYALNDPLTFVDPLGLASLVFDRATHQMTLLDGAGFEISRYEAANNTVAPDADPMQVGGNGPIPNGTYTLGVPEFASETYRADWYTRFGFAVPVEGESVAASTAWRGEMEEGYNLSQGMIRMRVGAANEGVDRVAYDRELFLHGGRRNNVASRTYGCIRARDDELETMAANMIELTREGDPVSTLTVR